MTKEELTAKLAKAETLLAISVEVIDTYKTHFVEEALCNQIYAFLGKAKYFDLDFPSYFGDSKIRVIKVVREATNVGLKEAKDIVELGGVLHVRLCRDKADELTKLLKSVYNYKVSLVQVI